jgi:hypothetical protein
MVKDYPEPKIGYLFIRDLPKYFISHTIFLHEPGQFFLNADCPDVLTG